MNWPRQKLELLAADEPYSFVGGPFGSKLTSYDYIDYGIPVIRGSNLNNGRFLDMNDFVYVSDLKVSKDLSSNLAKPCDLIFTQRGTLGQVAIIPEEGISDRYVVSQSQMKLTVDDAKADRLFLYYYFSSREAIERIMNFTSSSGVPHINLTVLRNFEVPVPPHETQKAIASILSAYDDLIENNRRRIRLLEQAARLLYKEWFVHFRFPGYEHVTITDGVPEGWERNKIADVCETVGGGTPSTKMSEYWEGDITWIVPSDVTKNDCLALFDSERKITEKGLRESSAKMIPAETILMTSRASVGFFALMDFEICTNQGFINIIPHENKLRMYLLFNLMSRVNEIRSNAKGTTYPEISKGRFRGMDIVVPSKALVSEFAQFASDIIQQVRCLKRSMLQLEAARDILLPRLMNGEVAV
ncbi:MAG: restriction endonuclease subunit S [Gammaproteobacteria bacterium]|nr:restriction endonuclease subunit S [Gammaproteobacteria bacterium]